MPSSCRAMPRYMSVSTVLHAHDARRRRATPHPAALSRTLGTDVALTDGPPPLPAPSTQALFLKHDGFVGAVGAHIAGEPQLRTQVERMAPADAFRDAADSAASQASVSPSPSVADGLGEASQDGAGSLEATLHEEIVRRRALEQERDRLREELSAARHAMASVRASSRREHLETP